MRMIDADALKAVFEEKSSEAVCGVEICKAIISRIDDAPTVDAEPVRHGKWIYGENESGYDGYYCSKCSEHVRWYGKASEQSINFIEKYNYCPHCGARMDDDERI